jgi:DNA repair protein RadC
LAVFEPGQLRCAVKAPVSGNRARSPEPTMSHELFSSLDAFISLPSPLPLSVRENDGTYRPATDAELLRAAQRVLAGQLRGTDMLSAPALVKDFLRVRLGALTHEVFAVIHLDRQHRLLDYVEMFRGTLTQTSVYPREVLKDVLVRNSASVVMVHNHPLC